MTQSRRAATRQHARQTARAHRRSGASRRYLLAAAAVVAAAGIAWLVLQRTQAGGTPSTDGSGFRQLGSVQAADYHALAFSPTEPNTLFFGHHNGVMQSSDGGRTWSAAVSRPNFDAMILSASPASPDVLWMAGHDVFYRSQDNGRNWTEVRSNLPGLDLHAFAVDAADPNLLYTFAVGYGLFRSLDAGTTWEPLGAGAPRAPTALATGGTAENLYVGTEQGVVISSDQGQSFGTPVGVGSGPVMALAAAPNSDMLYAGTPEGLYRSADGGQSWTQTGYAGDVAALAVHPTDPERVALVDRRGRVFGSA
jgi:photosystem II stability/assembly factor-like uncharacterized protein